MWTVEMYGVTEAMATAPMPFWCIMATTLQQLLNSLTASLKESFILLFSNHFSNHHHTVYCRIPPHGRPPDDILTII